MKLRDMIPVALGEKNADCILKNARILNVFTGEIEVADIALFDKRIAGVGSYDNSDNIIDLDGLYVIPGFIDAHVHIESTMLSPFNFAKLVILNGTTTVIADPHEIVNVMGVDGLEYINNSTEGIALNVYIAIPSCVPATSLETSGAKLGPDDMIGFIDSHLKRTVGLGEVMNYPGVLSLEPELITKIEILRHRYKKIDGHAPGLSGKKLNGYINAFIRSDHECTTKEEALEKLSKGMHIFIREGSAAKNFDALIPAVNLYNHQFFSFCTDDRDPLEITKQGHINNLVKRAVAKGLDPVLAIRMASINTAKFYNLRSCGAVAPGYKADLLVVDNLHDLNIKMVFHNSKLMVKDGVITGDMNGIYLKTELTGYSFKLPEVCEEDIKIKDTGRKIKVIGIEKASLYTTPLIISPTVKNGYILTDPARNISKVVILERHHASGYSVGFIHGLGIKEGAVATSVGHDSHNLCVCGMNDADIILAAQTVKKMNGGIAMVKNGRVIFEFPLPIAGLMSDKTIKEVTEKLLERKNCLELLGCSEDIFMTLSFIQLAVIPQIKITDKGIIDVAAQKIVSLYE